jgi:ABC-type transport system substrate-binding protein
MLVEARATTNEAERLARYQKFQEIVTADLPAIFLFSPTYTYVQGNKLQGVSAHSLIRPADRFSGVSHWYLKTDRRLSW